MTFLKVVVVAVTVAIIFVGCPASAQEEEEYEKVNRCMEKCQAEIDSATETAEWQCWERVPGKIGFNHHLPITKCESDCMGVPMAKDKDACLCKYCNAAEVMAVQFCTSPGETALKVKECDAMVCTGKAKMFGTNRCVRKD